MPLPAPHADPDLYEARLIKLPDQPSLVQIRVDLVCWKAGAASNFIWYDPKTSRFQLTPKPDCLICDYKGNGQFEIFAGGSSPFHYTDQAHWADGRFVTEGRRYSFDPRYLSPKGLAPVLQIMASEKVENEEQLFTNPDLLREFKAKTSPGTWTFAVAEIGRDQIRYRVSANDRPHGHLLVRMKPVTTVAHDPDNVQIDGLVWSDGSQG